MKLLFIFILSVTAIAGVPENQKCHTQNLITEPNSPFNTIPVYDQNGAGICYAYTAAQMMDYYAIKNGAPTYQYNPLYISVAATERVGKDFLTGGTAYDGIMALLDHGNCPYWDVIASIRTWIQREKIPDHKVLAIIESFSLRVTKSTQDPKAQPTAIDFALMLDESFQAHGEKCPQSFMNGLQDFLGEVTKLSPRQLVSNIIMSNCPKPLSVVDVPEPTQLSFQHFPTDDSTALKLKEMLNVRKGPVAIGFCSAVLTNPAYKGTAQFPKGRGVKDNNTCEGHEALIVGKKWMKESLLVDGKPQATEGCAYLLRNSWGNSWGEWNKHRVCVCKYSTKNPTTGKMEKHVEENCTFKQHGKENMSVEACYVPEEQLKANTFILTTL